MSQAPFQLPSTLYHGTRSACLPAVQTHGLVPRCVSGASNWAHTVESREDAVYLTTAYALHYARACEAQGWPTLLELNTAPLDPTLFASDEDGVAQLKQGREAAGADATLMEATAYWRDRIHTVHPSTSLSTLGTCTYFGLIPATAISRVLVLSPQEASRLTLQACDPTISIANFRYLGPEYQEFMRWLFEPTKPWSKGHFDVAAPLQSAKSWTATTAADVLAEVRAASQPAATQAP